MSSTFRLTPSEVIHFKINVERQREMRGSSGTWLFRVFTTSNGVHPTNPDNSLLVAVGVSAEAHRLAAEIWMDMRFSNAEDFMIKQIMASGRTSVYDLHYRRKPCDLYVSTCSVGDRGPAEERITVICNTHPHEDMVCESITPSIEEVMDLVAKHFDKYPQPSAEAEAETEPESEETKKPSRVSPARIFTKLGAMIQLEPAPDHLGPGAFMIVTMKDPGDPRRFEVYLDPESLVGLHGATQS